MLNLNVSLEGGPHFSEGSHFWKRLFHIEDVTSGGLTFFYTKYLFFLDGRVVFHISRGDVPGFKCYF